MRPGASRSERYFGRATCAESEGRHRGGDGLRDDLSHRRRGSLLVGQLADQGHRVGEDRRQGLQRRGGRRIDAGMLALKLDWPEKSTDEAAMATTLF